MQNSMQNSASFLARALLTVTAVTAVAGAAAVSGAAAAAPTTAATAATATVADERLTETTPEPGFGWG
ncbi:hypothetical protein [Streptomyces sp. NPDC046182]|uniref:hypothetical protein n=1 Tax=Streptomyces sp. NPDC046182 TaxID=3154601 RepID=UPI0033EB1527